MRHALLLSALASLAAAPTQDGPDAARSKAISDYACGETNERPDLTGLDCPTVLKAIRGRVRPAVEGRGAEQSRTHTLSNGHEATFYWYVPESYDPEKPTALAIFLHGGVSAPQPKRGRGQWRVWKPEADANGWIAASPSGDSECLWWRPEGEEHIRETIRHLAARYRIDRNRVFLAGFSDGASGTYCLGMRLTDEWAACIPWNGAVGVVTHPQAGATPFHAANCRTVAWRATHGGLDQLYPSAGQKPVMDRMKELGVPLEWKDFEDVGHEGGKIIGGDREFVDAWLARRSRDPKPVEIDWTTNDAGRYGQAYWLRVTKVGATGTNPFKDETEATFPVGQAGPPRPVLGVQIDQQFAGPGVRVAGVNEGSGAAEAGVKAGDVIVKVNGSDVANFDALRRVLSAMKSGDTAEVVLERGGANVELKVAFRPIEVKAAEVGRAGRVRATREGNAVRLLVKDVRAMEILASPDLFDLSKEIAVTVNGAEVWRGTVKPDPAFLLEETRRRLGDASVPYVARIPVEIPAERRDY